MTSLRLFTLNEDRQHAEAGQPRFCTERCAEGNAKAECSPECPVRKSSIGSCYDQKTEDGYFHLKGQVGTCPGCGWWECICKTADARKRCDGRCQRERTE